jgi:S1-C subfamily serine protease
MIAVRFFTALLVLLAAAPAMSQDRRVPASAAELKLSYAPIVQRVQPAVVNVYAAKVVQNRNPLLDDPIFRRFFGVPGQQPEQMQRSLGSGVMVDPSGLVVTNVHVIDGADEVKVSLADKREFEAEIVLKDPRTDLAVLRLKGVHEKFPTLDFANSDELLVGDVVLAIGNPFGVGQTVTHGISRRWRARKSASPTINSSFRPTLRSTRAIQAAPWSTSPASSPASTPRSSRAPADRRASVLRSRPIWCASWWLRRRAAARPLNGLGLARACRR